MSDPHFPRLFAGQDRTPREIGHEVLADAEHRLIRSDHRFGRGGLRLDDGCVPGELVEKSADVGPAIHRGLASGGPYVIDVRIDGSFKN